MTISSHRSHLSPPGHLPEKGGQVGEEGGMWGHTSDLLSTPSCLLIPFCHLLPPCNNTGLYISLLGLSALIIELRQQLHFILTNQILFIFFLLVLFNSSRPIKVDWETPVYLLSTCSLVSHYNKHQLVIYFGRTFHDFRWFIIMNPFPIFRIKSNDMISCKSAGIKGWPQYILE